MPVFRGTFLFQTGCLDSGWSESWYIDKPSHSVAATELAALALLRVDILSNSCKIQAAKVSDTHFLRDSLYLNGFPKTGGATQVGGTDEHPSVGVLTTFFADPYHQSHRILRGIPSSLVNCRQFLDAGPWKANLTAFVGMLIGSGWMIPFKDTGFMGVTSHAIKGIATRRVGRPFFLAAGRRAAG